MTVEYSTSDVRDLVGSDLATKNPTARQSYTVTTANIGLSAANNFDVRLYDNNIRIIQNSATLEAGNSTCNIFLDTNYQWRTQSAGMLNKYNKIS